MNTHYKEIQTSALELDIDQRAELAKTLIDSLDSKKKVSRDINKVWEIEIAKRKAEIQSGKVKPLEGTDVHIAARKLLR